MRQCFLLLIRKSCVNRYSSVKMGRKKRQNKRNPLPYKNERNYSQTSKDNALFKTYYAGLGLLQADEVEAFYNQLKEPLPVTFRITGYKSQAKELLKIIRTQFFDILIGESQSASSAKISTAPDTIAVPTTDDAAPSTKDITAECAAKGDAAMGGSAAAKGLTKETIKPPKCLTWYPDELAWQIDLSRKTVRSQDILSKLHEFLVTETETGNISRQEAVSMIPPLVLDIQPHSKVLDMCAAPGSKTAQLIEYLHKDENSVPEGFVVANDRENKRCYLMVHQVKRLSSPCCMIVNHDATVFPKLSCSADPDKPEFMLFDRVLADVPCSGDGTMRKNIDIWKKWHPAMAHSMHGLQLKILKRGLELLEVGGRLVYSTCSMHPVEDEAVIAEMLRKCEGSVKLVDISSHLPGFKTMPGLSQWKLMNKIGNWVKDLNSVPDRFVQQYSKSMFPPTPEEAEKFQLNLCHRVLPHHQDTGGFFVAALEKVDHLPWSREARLEKEKATKSSTVAEDASSSAVAGDATMTSASSTVAEGATSASLTVPEVPQNSSAAVENNGNGTAASSNPRKRKAETEEGPQLKKVMKKGYKEDPFLFLDPDDPVYPAIKNFYGLPDTFPINQLLYRSDTGQKRVLYFVSKAIRQIVVCNVDRVRFVNMGVKFVTRNQSPVVPDCDFRITQECLSSLKDVLVKRQVIVTKQDAITIFREENPFTNKMAEATQKILENISPGSVVFLYKPTESEPEPACEVAFCGWRGRITARCFIPYHERSHCLRLFGQDLKKLRAEVAKAKAERKAKAASSAEDGALPVTEKTEGTIPAPKEGEEHVPNPDEEMEEDKKM